MLRIMAFRMKLSFCYYANLMFNSFMIHCLVVVQQIMLDITGLMLSQQLALKSFVIVPRLVTLLSVRASKSHFIVSSYSVSFELSLFHLPVSANLHNNHF